MGGRMPSSYETKQYRDQQQYGPQGAPQMPDFQSLMQNMPQMQQAMTMMGYSPEAMQGIMGSYLKGPMAQFLGAGSGFNMDKQAFIGTGGANNLSAGAGLF